MGKIEKANRKVKNELNKRAKLEVKKIKEGIQSDINSSRSRIGKRIIKKDAYKRYSKIYLLYGQQSYLQNVPKRIRKRDLLDLYQDGEFLTIYEKHGEENFRKLQTRIMAEDIEYETGSRIRGDLFEIGKAFSNTMKKGLATITGILIGGNMLIPVIAEEKHKYDLEENVKEVSEYIDSINEYAENIKIMKLTDLEVIMKVMDDMWKSIDGYGNPKKDVSGCFGLDMSEENGVGVCRNMSDDVARKLNAINPKYNARIIAVEAIMDSKEVKLANIDRSIVSTIEEEKNEVVNPTAKNVLIGAINAVASEASGNHAVVLMDIPEDNITLIVDPTNPAIGMYKNGKIKMFNSTSENGFIINRKLFGEEILCGLETKKLPKEYIDSFLPYKLSEQELEEKYGVEAQNLALRRLRMRNSDNLYEELKKYYEEKGTNVEKELRELPSGSQTWKNDIQEQDEER